MELELFEPLDVLLERGAQLLEWHVKVSVPVTQPIVLWSHLGVGRDHFIPLLGVARKALLLGCAKDSPVARQRDGREVEWPAERRTGIARHPALVQIEPSPWRTLREPFVAQLDHRRALAHMESMYSVPTPYAHVGVSLAQACNLGSLRERGRQKRAAESRAFELDAVAGRTERCIVS